MILIILYIGGKKMTKLNCSVTSCVHNEDRLCCLSGIKVEGTTANVSEGTACGSFVERSRESYKNSCRCEQPRQSLTIECMAQKCVYNDDCKCTAPHIDVAGDGACDCGDTRCATFSSKES